MALQLSSAGFCFFRGRRALTTRAVASENVTTLKEEDKVKLGSSDVKVTRLGLGAWSWGDTSYWNDSGWDGNASSFDLYVIL